MSFDIVTERVSAKPVTGVSISLFKKGSAKRARCTISFSQEKAREFEIKDKDKFQLGVGKDENTGRIMLMPDGDAAFVAVVMAKGGVRLNLGFVDAFPNEAADREYVNATKTDAGILIDLPEWGQASEE